MTVTTLACGLSNRRNNTGRHYHHHQINQSGPQPSDRLSDEGGSVGHYVMRSNVKGSSAWLALFMFEREALQV